MVMYCSLRTEVVCQCFISFVLSRKNGHGGQGVRLSVDGRATFWKRQRANRSPGARVQRVNGTTRPSRVEGRGSRVEDRGARFKGSRVCVDQGSFVQAMS